MKQVDVLAICSDTGRRVALECVCSTLGDPEHEPSQALKDLSSGADAVVVVAPTREALKKLQASFTAAYRPLDPRITLALPCHLAEAPSFRHVYECPALVYDPHWDKAEKPTTPRR